jgi:hypothetical protein
MYMPQGEWREESLLPSGGRMKQLSPFNWMGEDYHPSPLPWSLLQHVRMFIKYNHIMKTNDCKYLVIHVMVNCSKGM